MARPSPQDLSRRQRQIMDIVYRRERVTAGEVQAEMPRAPGYSSVRTMLRILEEKGHLTHVQEGFRYVYSATVPKAKAKDAALRRLVRTFFDDSSHRAVAALLDLSRKEMSQEELADLARLIDRARREGR